MSSSGPKKRVRVNLPRAVEMPLEQEGGNAEVPWSGSSGESAAAASSVCADVSESGERGTFVS